MAATQPPCIPAAAEMRQIAQQEVDAEVDKAVCLTVDLIHKKALEGKFRTGVAGCRTQANAEKIVKSFTDHGYLGWVGHDDNGRGYLYEIRWDVRRS